MTLSDEQKPTEAIAIEICEYTEEMASDVAAMWNTWDELWPGGFTQGIPYTAERVQKQFGKSNALAILIAYDNKTNKPLGSCTLYAHWRDSEAAYIGTLGVSPEALGKKVGKRLLLESIKRASLKGYTRVDLNTWAGNMKAVPLYKKIGMMWNPEIGGVHMEDYIPGILNHSISRPFFESLTGDNDWYNVHERDPVQAPDDFKLDGVAIYPYEFESDGNKLSVTVDRYGRGISAVERIVDSSRLKINAKVNSHQILCGLPYIYTLEVVNETKNDLNFSTTLEAFEGLVFDEDSTLTRTISVGERIEWSVPFHLEPSAPLYRDSIKSPNIVTQVTIEGEKSELITGLKVLAAAEIRTRWGIPRIAAGGKTEIPLTIISNLGTKSIAWIHLEKVHPSISVESSDKKIKLPADGFGGTVLSVSTDSNLEEGAHDIWVSLGINLGEETKVQTRKFRVPVYCLGEKGVVVGRDDKDRQLVIASPTYTATFSEEGAILRVRNEPGSLGFGHQLRSTIGPPFGINPFRFAERKSSFTVKDNETVVSMRANHPDRPLEIEDRVRFEHGSGIILHEVWARNTNSEDETFQLRVMGRGGDITFTEGSAYLPLSSGLTRTKLGSFYSIHPAIPSDPSVLAEGWIANDQEDTFTGQLWDHSKVEEVRVGLGQIGLIGYPQVTLGSGETQCLSKVWLVYGAQSWEQVRRTWQFRIAGYYENQVDAIRSGTVKDLLDLKVPPIIISSKQETEGRFHLSKSTLVTLPGTLRFTSPEGWMTSMSSDETDMNTTEEGFVASAEIQLMQDSAIDFKLTPDSKLSDSFGIHRGVIEFDTTWSVKKPVHLIQLGTGKGTVEVQEDVDKGLKVFRINNGLIDFTVSADYGGCLISLRNKNNVEFMTSSFPTAAPKQGGFFDNYFGGIQPVVFDEEMGEDFTKARTNREKMSGKSVEIGFWKGVEVKWVGKLQKLTRGIEFKLRYLTSPNSPLVYIRWAIKNKTKSPMKFWPTLLIDPDLSKQFAGGSYQTDWDGKVTEMRKGMVPLAVTPSQNILWLKPNTNQAETTGFGFMMAGHDARMLSASLGEAMILAAVDGMTWLMPGEEKVITASILVDPENFEDLRVLQGELDKFE